MIKDIFQNEGFWNQFDTFSCKQKIRTTNSVFLKCVWHMKKWLEMLIPISGELRIPTVATNCTHKNSMRSYEFSDHENLIVDGSRWGSMPYNMTILSWKKVNQMKTLMSKFLTNRKNYAVERKGNSDLGCNHYLTKLLIC